MDKIFNGPEIYGLSNEKISAFIKGALKTNSEFFAFPAVCGIARYAFDAPAAEKVLDIGYNAGHSTLWLTFLTRAPIVHAIDIIRYNVYYLRKLMKETAPGVHLHPLQGSVADLPYRENTFDVVFCRSVLQYIDQNADIGKAISEMRRVLKPTGRGYIIANLAGNPFVNIFRLMTVKQRSIPFGAPRGYISFRMLREWERNGWCIPRREFHLIAPFFYLSLEWLPIKQIKYAVYHCAALIDAVSLKLFPFFKRFAWLAFFEIKK